MAGISSLVYLPVAPVDTLNGKETFIDVGNTSAGTVGTLHIGTTGFSSSDLLVLGLALIATFPSRDNRIGTSVKKDGTENDKQRS